MGQQSVQVTSVDNAVVGERQTIYDESPFSSGYMVIEEDQLKKDMQMYENQSAEPGDLEMALAIAAVADIYLKIHEK